MQLLPSEISNYHGNADLCLPRGYSARDEAQFQYYSDIHYDDLSYWQPEIYPFAEHIASRLASPKIMDIGCGSGRGLASLRNIFSTIGIDFGDNIKRAQETYPDHNWLEIDLDNISGREQMLFRQAEGSLLICSDVIEQLKKPEAVSI